MSKVNTDRGALSKVIGLAGKSGRYMVTGNDDGLTNLSLLFLEGADGIILKNTRNEGCLGPDGRKATSELCGHCGLLEENSKKYSSLT